MTDAQVAQQTLRTRLDQESKQWSVRFDEVVHTQLFEVRLGHDLGSDQRVAAKRPHDGDRRATALLYHEAWVGDLLHRHYGRSWMRYPDQLVRYLGEGEDPSTFLLWTSRGSPLIGQVPLGDDVLRRFAVELLTGLAYLDHVGIVHRDLKPDNVLWDGARCQIIDFSAAAYAGDPRAVVGVRDWMAPEQRDGIGPVHVRDDVYSAGRLIAYAAIGGNPARPPTDEDVAAHLDGPIREVVELATGPFDLRPRAKDLLELLGEDDPTANLQTAYAELALYTQGRDEYNQLVRRKQRNTPLLAQPPVPDLVVKVCVALGVGLLVLVAALALFGS